MVEGGLPTPSLSDQCFIERVGCPGITHPLAQLSPLKLCWLYRILCITSPPPQWHQVLHLLVLENDNSGINTISYIQKKKKSTHIIFAKSRECLLLLSVVFTSCILTNLKSTIIYWILIIAKFLVKPSIVHYYFFSTTIYVNRPIFSRGKLLKFLFQD